MFGMILQWFASGSNGRVQGIAERFHPSFGILALGLSYLRFWHHIDWHHFLHPHVWFKLTCHRITDFIMLGGGMILHSITDLYCNVGEGTGKLPATRIAQQLQVAGKSFNQCSHHALPLLQAWRNWPKRWPSEHTQRVEMSTYNKNCNIFEIPCKKKFQRMISWDHFGVPLFQCTWYILKLFVSMTKHSSNIDVHASKILQKKVLSPWDLAMVACDCLHLDAAWFW